MRLSVQYASTRCCSAWVCAACWLATVVSCALVSFVVAAAGAAIATLAPATATAASTDRMKGRFIA
jgi:hypothetical protein